MNYPGTRNPDLLLAINQIDSLIGQVFASCEYDNHEYEFGVALQVALTSPKSLRRWHDRKRVFTNIAQEN